MKDMDRSEYPDDHALEPVHKHDGAKVPVIGNGKDNFNDIDNDQREKREIEPGAAHINNGVRRLPGHALCSTSNYKKIQVSVWQQVKIK